MLLDETEATKDLPRADRLGDPAGKMKQFTTWFTHGLPGGARLRAAVYKEKTGTAVLAEVERFFLQPPLPGDHPMPDDSADNLTSFPEDAPACS
jgi:hypothetical protein